ncbi:bacillithiol biosynthesis deacetylase BshB1 [bacterium]|nr:bacillithiol biosynthesis deacetylase BshB1 [candidate division CSSED10-310 bacterium]
MKTDVLAIGAHPDDIELIIGGTISKLTLRGKNVVIADLTRGEMGTRGTPDIRREEARKAAEILGVRERINLDLGDGKLSDVFEYRIRIIELIRKFRPVLVFTHHWHDLHPDHTATAEIVKSSMYTCGMVNFPAKGEPYRPHEFAFFMGHLPFEPSFIVDISETFDKKMQAIKCYESQLYNPSIAGFQTNISQPDFLVYIEARARYYGSLIQKAYGEPFEVIRALPMDDPVDHYREFGKI